MLRVEIRVQGRIDEHWASWFSDLEIRPAEGDTTILAGTLPDQAALYGLLARLRDLGLPLISLRRARPRGRGRGT